MPNRSHSLIFDRAVEGQSLVTEVRTVLQQELAAYKIR